MICDKCGGGYNANKLKFTLVWLPLGDFADVTNATDHWEKWHICPFCTRLLKAWLIELDAESEAP